MMIKKSLSMTSALKVEYNDKHFLGGKDYGSVKSMKVLLERDIGGLAKYCDKIYSDNAG